MLTFTKFNEAIEIIYKISTDSSALPWLLEFIFENSEIPSGSFTIHDTKTLSLIKRVAMGIANDPQYKDNYHENIFRYDIWAKSLLANKIPSKFIPDHQAVSRRIFNQSALKPIMTKFDIISAAGAHWNLPNNQTLRISFQKATRQGLFKKNELSTLNALAPHIGRAIEISHQIESNNKITWLDQYLEVSDKCVALISTLGTLAEANTAFEKFCSKNKQVRIIENILSFTDLAIQKRFKIFLDLAQNSILNVPKNLILTLPSGDNDADFQATLTPLQTTQATCNILITIQPISVRLTDKFGYLLTKTDLTKSELDVIFKLSKNLSVTEIAKIKNRSVHTIRTQIKSIQNKLQVNSQAAIIGKIFQL